MKNLIYIHSGLDVALSVQIFIETKILFKAKSKDL